MSAWPFGANWTFRYGANLIINPDTTVSAARPDGKVFDFTPPASGNTYTGDADVSDTLNKVTDGSGNIIGWTYKVAASGDVEEYDAAGHLTAITELGGKRLTLSYSDANTDPAIAPAAGLLIGVQHPDGRQLSFAYNADSRIVRMTDPQGQDTTFAYDGPSEYVRSGELPAGDLTSVTFPGGASRTYHYNEPGHTNNVNLPTTLTGITDEAGVRYASWNYDDHGRATVSEHAGSTERVDLVYNADGTTTANDGSGASRTYHFSIIHGVVKPNQIDGEGWSESYTYDASGYLDTKTDKEGIVTDYDYDAQGRKISVTEAVGTAQVRRTDYLYTDPNFPHRVTEIHEPSVINTNPGVACTVGTDCKVTSFSYDAYGNRSSVTVSGFDPQGNPVSRSASLQYNGPLHQLSLIDGPRTDVSDTTTLSYYPDDAAEGTRRAKLKQIQDASGVLLRANIQYNADAKVTAEDRPNNLSLSYTYYTNGRLETLTESDGVASRTTHWTYRATGEVETITTGYGTAAATTLTLTYDAARRLEYITDGLGNYLHYTLDGEGNRKVEETYDNGGLLRRQITRTFDIYNQLNTGATANESTDKDFAADGTLDKETDGRSVVTDYSYDALRRLTSVTQDLNGTDTTTANALISYGYDVADRLTSVTDPVGGNTSYSYDDLGNRLSQSSPDSGTTSYTYNSAGDIATRTDAKGQLFGYHYDVLGRIQTLDAPGSDDDIAYTYDSCTNGTGRLCTVTYGAGSANPEVVSYTYNAFGEVTAHQGMGYGYDVAGRLQTLTYPSGTIITLYYDAAGQVSQVDAQLPDGSTKTLASGITYAPFGPVTNLYYGNTLSLSRTLDSAYRYQDISVTGALTQSNILYDGNGNLQSRNNDTTAESFDYDALNRINSGSGLFGSRGYVYDKNGNRTQKSVYTQITDYTYELQSNRLDYDSDWDVTLDANGNMLSKLHNDTTGWVYTFSPYNRLINATEHTITGYSGKGGNQTPIYGDVVRGDYRYNGLGQRVEKSTGGVSTRYVYGLNGQLLSELNSAGTPQRDYVTLNGEPLAVITYTVQQGGLGTVIDNGEAGTTSTGTWTTATDNKNTQWGSDYLEAAGATGSTYRWTPTLASGTYNVYTWYVADNKAATQVPYTLVHNGVTDTVNIDQTTNGGQWVLLGTYTFSGDGTEYVEVSDANGQTNADALRFDPQGLPPQLVADIHYIHTDQLATPRAITDSSGTVVWRWESDPFGTTPANEDADGDGIGFVYNPRFPGQYFDQETGLHYNYFRDYDPSTGRYVESDPIGLRGGLNTFAYVGGQPISRIDPLGLFRFPNEVKKKYPDIVKYINSIDITKNEKKIQAMMDHTGVKRQDVIDAFTPGKGPCIFADDSSKYSFGEGEQFGEGTDGYIVINEDTFREGPTVYLDRVLEHETVHYLDFLDGSPLYVMKEPGWLYEDDVYGGSDTPILLILYYKIF